MKIGFIGSNGIPNVYGGFESFLEAICPVLVKNGHDIFVTCDAKHHPQKEESYKGVQKIYINIRANGALSTLHDAVAFFRCFLKVDKIVVLGVSAGPFFILFRIFSQLSQKKLVVNIDGIEWRRGKFSPFIRGLLRVYDFLAQLCANTIVYDNNALRPYVFPFFRKKSIFVAYSADHLGIKKDIEPIKNHCLTICRIEPENNIELIIDGFLNSNLLRYTIIGNWNKSEYGRNLIKKYENNNRLALLSPNYDQNFLVNIRSECAIYIHGHSVGGTNPSLIEMIGYRCHLICFDCDFNKDSVGSSANYFNNKNDLTTILNNLNNIILNDTREIPKKFTSKYIAELYAEI